MFVPIILIATFIDDFHDGQHVMDACKLLSVFTYA